MTFIKLGEPTYLKLENVESCIPAVSPEILESFRKTAADLKKIAPKAEDFLYFSAVMMHAAEAAGINDDGTPKLTLKGENVQVGWDKRGGTWRWTTNDPSIKPYKNCFVPGTQILMENGSSKNIEDIEPGEKVISHTGKAREVLRKFITPHAGTLFQISIRNGHKILVTDNHPFYVLKISSRSNSKASPLQLLRQKKSIKNYQFVPAKDLKKQDILLSPIGNNKTQRTYENYALWTISSIINQVDYNGKVYNLEVDEDHTYVANNTIVSNCNGDIFPEEELVKAYKKWQHKPLCIDHKSSSVDHVRGFIVDTYYDRHLKRVIALCALDKHNYPDLARKVATGYSNSVSMGTAVGRAICSETDCATVARTEADFCKHMKNKTGYGEINIDLNPIELSIVVNGADPKASIKHVMAAANTLNSYVDSKSLEFNKLANVTQKDLTEFKSDIDTAFKKFQEIMDSVKNSEKDTNDLAFNQSSDNVIENEGEMTPNADLGLAPPHERYAQEQVSTIASSIEHKINNITQSLEKLARSINTHEETDMSSKEISKKGYFHGTEDPTPGQAKYPVDKGHMAYEDDKHLQGQGPFPDVGSVDGIYPGVDSAGMSELDRKKMLARAEADERAMRRQAIVNLAKQAIEDKKGYFNNGDEKNPGAPTPGKPKYPIDKGHMAYEDDKHLQGQKPFPDVGPVDGLHPSPASADISDELKRKEMLRRANTLHGTFVRASKSDGSRDLGNSTWEIRLGNKLLLSASVKDLSGGQSEMMYDSINTPEFGQRLLEKVKVHGVDRVRSLVKSGQQEPPAASPPVDAGPPPADISAPTAPSTGATPPSEDTGKTGDPKESAVELAEKVRDVSSDLVEAVRALTGEQAEMGAPGDMGATASDFNTGHLNTVKREINQSLIEEMTKTIAQLEDHQQELDLIVDMYNKGSLNAANNSIVDPVLEEAKSEAKIAVADGFRLLTTFVKYARSSKAIDKRAEAESELEALNADGETMSADSTNQDGSDLMNLIQDTDQDLNSVREMMEENDNDDALTELDHLDDLGETNTDELTETDELEPDLGDSEFAVDDNDLMAKPSELKDLNVKPGTNVQVTAGFNSKHSRTAMRAKIAADASGKQDDGQLQDMSKARFSDMLDQADSLTNGQTKLETKPSDDLGYVETLPEINKKMMDLAKAPPKVRKEAEVIHKLVSEGKLDPSDLDGLVSEGLDKDAVAYYKKYYGEVEGGGDFANKLVKEHVKAELENEINKYRIKLARAYEVAYDMVERGLCYYDKTAIASQVDEIMKFNDDSFETLKRVVAKHAPTMRKEAGRLPQNGLIGSGEINSIPSAEDDWSLLSAAFSKTSKRMF